MFGLFLQQHKQSQVRKINSKRNETYLCKLNEKILKITNIVQNHTSQETQRWGNIASTLLDVATKRQSKINVVRMPCASWDGLLVN